MKDRKIFVNDKDPWNQTRSWYEQLNEKTGMPK